MDPEIKEILEKHSHELDEIYHSVEQTRKYFLWTLIATAVFIILPLIGIVFLLPTMMSVLTGGLL